jgi:dTDP-D-glucose 4,6-dehydratase
LGHDFRYSVDATRLSKLGFSLNGNKEFEKNLKETIVYFMEKKKRGK